MVTTILVTGAGSLVAKCLLDALEGRRDRLRLIGFNSMADAPGLHRFDRVVIGPATADPQFTAAFRRLVEEERPALIIPGRDADVVRLAELAAVDPSLRPILPGGPPDLARMMNDKALTARFSFSHHLPFVATVCTDDPNAEAAAAALVRSQGFPLIAKPRAGFGSHGVRILHQPGQLARALTWAGMVIQPYLDPPPLPTLDPADGTPLFFQVPEDRLYGVQSLIEPDGSLGPSLAFRSRMVLGRCEQLLRVEDPLLLALGRRFATWVAEAGWRGPFNVQAKRDAAGHWRAIELNGRFSGGTSARRFLGLDEVALVVNAWCGAGCVPVDGDRPRVTRVDRLLSDYPCGDGRLGP
jgi:hypothetical protein